MLTRLQAFPDDDPPPRPETDLDEYKGQLAASIEYLRDDLANDLEVFFSKPTRLLSTSAIALLGGIFAATSAATIIGSVADWDPLAAAVLLIWTEAFTKYYYYLEKRSRFLQIINAFKIGLIYGMILDAFKLST